MIADEPIYSITSKITTTTVRTPPRHSGRAMVRIISAETNGWHGSELGPSGYRSDSFGVRRQSAASDRNQTVCMATAVFAGGRRCSVPHVARRRRFGFRLLPIQSGVGSVPTSVVRCDQPITGDYPNHRGIRLPPHSKGR